MALGKTLPIPQRYYAAIAHWDQLVLLRGSRDMKHQALARTAIKLEKLERLVEILDDDHGYALWKAVTRLKMDLSRARSQPSPSSPAPSVRADGRTQHFRGLDRAGAGDDRDGGRRGD